MKRTIQKNTLSFSTSKSMQYLRTPIDIWKELSEEFDFTLDACASDNNHLLPKYYTQENSCLDKDWTGEVVYCHPMFDIYIPNFVKKCAESKCLSVMLLPASTHTRYFHTYVWDKNTHTTRKNVELRLLEKPVKGFRFLNDDGSDDNLTSIGYIKPLMILVFKNNK